MCSKAELVLLHILLLVQLVIASNPSLVNLADVKGHGAPSFFALGAGRGDTGTSQLHNIVCSLGLRSQHYHTCCNFPDQENTSMPPKPLRIKRFKDSGYEPGLFGHFRQFRSTVSKRSPATVQRWLDKFQSSLPLVSNLGSLVGDTPIPFFFEDIFRLNPRVPVIHMIHEAENGTVWATRRQHSGHGAHDIICHPDLFDDVPDPFNVFECAAAAAQRNLTRLDRIFVYGFDSHGIAKIGAAYMRYVNAVREIVSKIDPNLLLEIDLFECTARIGHMETLVLDTYSAYNPGNKTKKMCNITSVKGVVLQFLLKWW